MGRISKLSPALASQIAAGEVVERPASAIKELIENALDAEAMRIDVEIEGGGVSRIRVRDDGFGMSPEDARLCVERHATSKLTRFEDLNQLGSYGFRGEALPSIASVCRFQLETRVRGSDVGTRVVVQAGELLDAVEVGIPVGTQIELRDLFHNVPARRKFLRSSGTESGHVAEVVEAAALSAPRVTFTLMRDGRKAREWLRVNDRAARVSSVLGDEELMACLGERGPLKVEAYLGRPERARAGASALRLFCNGRPIRDRAVLHTLAQAYGSVLERGRYPRGVVYLELPKELVDVNVHPQKSEVRFADGRAVTDALYDIVSAQLGRAFSLPNPGNRWVRPEAGRDLEARAGESQDVRGSVTGGASAQQGASGRDGRDEPPREHERDDSDDRISEVTPRSIRPPEHLPDPAEWGRPRRDLLAAEYGSRQQSLMQLHEAPAPLPAVRPPSSDADVRWNRLRFVAQVRATYLICEGDEGLFVIDQHAAAERVNFHRLKQQYQKSQMPSQALLFPVTLDVSAQQSELIASHDQDIQRLGFEVRIHGEDKVSVHRVPRLLQRDSTERLFRDLLAELARAGRGFSAAVDGALSTIACHGSVRAGDVLDREQGAALLRALDGVDFASHCPHGRPIVAFTSWSELERKVGRR